MYVCKCDVCACMCACKCVYKCVFIDVVVYDCVCVCVHCVCKQVCLHGTQLFCYIEIRDKKPTPLKKNFEMMSSCMRQPLASLSYTTIIVMMWLHCKGLKTFYLSIAVMCPRSSALLLGKSSTIRDMKCLA